MIEGKLLGFERPGALARPKTFIVLALSSTPMRAAFTADRGDGKIKFVALLLFFRFEFPRDLSI
jgi:hypothetical protein